MPGRKVTEGLQNEDNHRNYFFDVFFKIKATIEEAGPAGAISLLSTKLRHCSNNVSPVLFLYLEFTLQKKKNCVAYDDGHGILLRWSEVFFISISST